MILHDFVVKLSPLLVSHLDELRPLHRRPLLQFHLPADIDHDPRNSPLGHIGEDTLIGQWAKIGAAAGSVTF